jgi:hypothetical protein
MWGSRLSTGRDFVTFRPGKNDELYFPDLLAYCFGWTFSFGLNFFFSPHWVGWRERGKFCKEILKAGADVNDNVPLPGGGTSI